MLPTTAYAIATPRWAQAAGGLATPQVRNLGTLGGNLNQRPRCWYYRHPLTVCLKRGGDRCYAIQGVGKYLCVTGGDRCFIVHPSDIAVALAALGASVTIASQSGERTVAIADYFVGPDVDLMRENILQPGELLTALTLPSPADGQRSIYLKARERESGDFALVSVAAALVVEDGVIAEASVALGGVAPTPYRSQGTEEYLRGRAVADVSPADAGAAAIVDPRPPSRQRLQASDGLQPDGAGPSPVCFPNRSARSSTIARCQRNHRRESPRCRWPGEAFLDIRLPL